MYIKISQSPSVHLSEMHRIGLLATKCSNAATELNIRFCADGVLIDISIWRWVLVIMVSWKGRLCSALLPILMVLCMHNLTSYCIILLIFPHLVSIIFTRYYAHHSRLWEYGKGRWCMCVSDLYHLSECREDPRISDYGVRGSQIVLI